MSQIPTPPTGEADVKSPSAYDQLNDGVREEVDKWIAYLNDNNLIIQLTGSNEVPILTATFTESAPTPATKTYPSPPSSDRSNTIQIQRVILNGEPGVVNDDKNKYTLMNVEVPNLQPLAWKTSAESNREWSFFDELIHCPDAEKYPLQNQVWRIFHDDRRRDLIQDYLPIYQHNQGTHLAIASEFGLYTFDVGRPHRVWTAGGYGSVEVGFEAGYKSSLGGCMYTYEEADVIYMTEAEHAIWSAYRNNSPKNIIISDEAFNRRRPAKSTQAFLAEQDRKAKLNNINIDVQKLEVAVEEHAAIRMNLKDALRELKTSKKDEPVSVHNPPRNLLNITDQSHGHWVEGMTKNYTLMSDLVQDIDTKIYADIEDLKGVAAIGKPPAVVKHHSDMQKCGQFRIYADRGAISRWHMDQCGVNTFTHLEGNTNDASERDEDVVKYWPSFPMQHLTEEEQKETWSEYAKFGEDWRPRPKGGIPVISILKGQMLIQVPGNIHAPITLTNCLFIGGMAWKNNTVKDHIKSFRFTCENTNCTNEEVPRQAQEFVVNLQKMIHADPTTYGYSAGDDLQELDEAIPIIYSGVTMCLCRGTCKIQTCECVAAAVHCGNRCHGNKVFDRKKACNKWALKPVEYIPSPEPAAEGEEVAPVPKRKGLITGAQKRRLDEEEQQAYQPDVKRQRRQTSEAPEPKPAQKKMSAREKNRLGKPCTNCERSGMRTFSLGPTGASMCSNCNKKWALDGKPPIWGSMKKPEDLEADVQHQSPAPEAPEASDAPKASEAPATKRKIFDDSDDEAEIEVSAPKRQKTMASEAEEAEEEVLVVATISAPRPEGPASAQSCRPQAPRSSTGNFFKTAGSIAPNPFRQSGMSSPREAIASPITAPLTTQMGAPVTQSTAFVAASREVELSSTQQLSNASVASTVLDEGALDNPPAPPRPARRKHTKLPQACYLCRSTKETVWKRVRLGVDDTTTLICADCDVPPTKASAEKAPVEKAAAPAPVPAAAKAVVQTEPIKKAPGTKKVPGKKKPVAAQVPKRSRRGGGEPLVEMNLWDSKAALRKQPSGKMISDAIVKNRNLVVAEATKHESSSGDELSILDEAEFEGLEVL